MRIDVRRRGDLRMAEDPRHDAESSHFAVDIVARTSGPEPRPIIIENELAPIDHCHLGQLTTYAAGKQAAIAVSILAKVREKHRQAIDWLDSISDEGIDFFAIEVEALRIDDSIPAAHFKVVARLTIFMRKTRPAGRLPSARLRMSG